MRYEALDPGNHFDTLDVAAVWPATTQVAPLPIPELTASGERITSPASAVPDVPAAVGAMIIGSYVTLLAALALATAVPGQSLFAIGIAAFFLAMFFSVPAMLLGMSQAGRRPLSLQRFLRDGMQTGTGHCGGSAALVQMLVVPVCLTFGVIGMGIAVAVIF